MKLETVPSRAGTSSRRPCMSRRGSPGCPPRSRRQGPPARRGRRRSSSRSRCCRRSRTAGSAAARRQDRSHPGARTAPDPAVRAPRGRLARIAVHRRRRTSPPRGCCTRDRSATLAPPLRRGAADVEVEDVPACLPWPPPREVWVAAGPATGHRSARPAIQSSPQSYGRMHLAPGAMAPHHERAAEPTTAARELAREPHRKATEVADGPRERPIGSDRNPVAIVQGERVEPERDIARHATSPPPCQIDGRGSLQFPAVVRRDEPDAVTTPVAAKRDITDVPPAFDRLPGRGRCPSQQHDRGRDNREEHPHGPTLPPAVSRVSANRSSARKEAAQQKRFRGNA